MSSSKERLALVLESFDERLCHIEELLAQGVEHQEQTRQGLHDLRSKMQALITNVDIDLGEIKKLQREVVRISDSIRIYDGK